MQDGYLDSIAMIMGGAMTVSLAFGIMLGAVLAPVREPGCRIEHHGRGSARMGEREDRDQKEIEGDGQQKGRPIPPEDPGKGTGKRGK
jgi:hypothetical protein